MSTNEIGDALSEMTKWLQNGNLYYSIDDKRYLVGFNGGMGNFDLYELPTEWTKLIVESDISEQLSSAAVIGELRSANPKNNNFQGYFVKISKVTNIQFHENQ